jgi:hypothetical protein
MGGSQIYQAIPPLSPGELSIGSFSAAQSAGPTGSMKVSLMDMDGNIKSERTPLPRRLHD